MRVINRKFDNLFLVLSFISFVLISLFGVSHIMGMQTQSDGTMSGCLFTGMDAICTMTFIEHLTVWQNIFIMTIPRDVSAFVLLALFVLVFAAAAVFERNPRLLLSYYITHWRLYIKRDPDIFLLNYLQESFSQGILNPKIH